MKTKTFTATVITFLVFLFSISLFSYYCRREREKLSSLVLEKLHHTDQEIVILKHKIAKSKTQTSSSTQEKLEEKNLLTRIFHGSHSEAKEKADETRRRQDCDQGCMSPYRSDQNSTTTQYSSALDKLQTERHEISGLTPSDLQTQAALKKITFPSNFFSLLEQKFNLKSKSKKTFQHQQKQLILIEIILGKILCFPKSKIEKLELENEHDNSSKNIPETALLGTLLLTISMREEQLQKLFNSIANDDQFFVISSVSISNSNPNPPLHHSIYSKEKLVPILGNETVTATLKVKLFNVGYNHVLSKCEWSSGKTKALLFTSRHYATKNEAIIDPIESPQALCPPIPNEWIVNNNLDYSNPNILFEDSDQTGFNNLEKWQGNNPIEEPGKFPSDPNDPTSHPLLWTKLRCHQKDISSEIYSIYFLGLRSSKKEKLFQIQPSTVLPSKNDRGKTVFNKKIRYAHMGEPIEGLPYKVVNYQEKQINYKNTCYDSSELIIEHLDTKEQVAVIKKTPYHTQPCRLTNITSIKIENTIFEPPQAINLKIGDYFSLDYFLPNKGFSGNENAIERETYQLIDASDSALTIQNGSHQYKIPIIPEKLNTLNK